jgi:hypothetical protein
LEELVLRDTSGFLDEFLDSEFSSLETLTLYGYIGDYDPQVLEIIDRTATSVVDLEVTADWDDFQSHIINIVNRVSSIKMHEDQEIQLELPENVIRLRTLILPGYLGGMQFLTELVLERVDLWLAEDDELLALEYLDVGGEPYHEQANSTLRFPNLRHLRIPGNAPFLLANITAPKLERLRLQKAWSKFIVDDDQELDREEIADRYQDMFDGDSFPSSIESLTITYPLEPKVLSGILEKAPRLLKLDLTTWEMMEAEEIIRSLSSDSDGPSLETSGEVIQTICPDLASLTIRYQGGMEIRTELESLCQELMKKRGSFGLAAPRLLCWNQTGQLIPIENVAELNDDGISGEED